MTPRPPPDAHRSRPDGAAALAGTPLEMAADAPRATQTPAARESTTTTTTPATDAPQPRPRTLASVYAALCRPFSANVLEAKPIAVAKDRKTALVALYADPRAYKARLDRVVGPDHWTTDYTVTPAGVVCRLTIYGVCKSATGDLPLEGDNKLTSAEAQAFKRACAEFGLGRYLYAIPHTWAAFDDSRKQFVDAAGVIARICGQLERSRGDE